MTDIDLQNPFKPEDFESVTIRISKQNWPFGENAHVDIIPVGPTENELRQFSEIANRRFRELLEECPEVYQDNDGHCGEFWREPGVKPQPKYSNKIAKLICIKEITKE